MGAVQKALKTFCVKSANIKRIIGRCLHCRLKQEMRVPKDWVTGCEFLFGLHSPLSSAAACNTFAEGEVSYRTTDWHSIFCHPVISSHKQLKISEPGAALFYFISPCIYWEGPPCCALICFPKNCQFSFGRLCFDLSFKKWMTDTKKVLHQIWSQIWKARLHHSVPPAASVNTDILSCRRMWMEVVMQTCSMWSTNFKQVLPQIALEACHFVFQIGAATTLVAVEEWIYPQW